MKRLLTIFCFLFSAHAGAVTVDDLMEPFSVVTENNFLDCCVIEEQLNPDYLLEKTPKRFFVPVKIKVKATSVLVIDQETGAVMYEKNSEDVVPIASITKLMTAMVTLDANLDMNEPIRIDQSDIRWLKVTKSRLKDGTVLPRSEILRLALMSSDNRAAHALARTYPGGVNAFVAAMNAKVEYLKMKDTEFHDPTGLTPSNVSTANDLALLVDAAYQYDTIRQYSTTERHKLALKPKKRLAEFRNSNALIHTHSWKIGLSKTGYIRDAGRCVVMQTEISERPIIIILLDSSTKKTRVKDATILKQWVETVVKTFNF